MSSSILLSLSYSSYYYSSCYYYSFYSYYFSYFCYCNYYCYYSYYYYYSYYLFYYCTYHHHYRQHHSPLLWKRRTIFGLVPDSLSHVTLKHRVALLTDTVEGGLLLTATGAAISIHGVHVVALLSLVAEMEAGRLIK